MDDDLRFECEGRMISRRCFAVALGVFFIMSTSGHEIIAQSVRNAPMIPGTDVQFLPDGQMTDKKIAVFGDLVGVKFNAVPVASCYRNIELHKGIYKGVAIYKIRMLSEKRLVYSTFVPPCTSG